MIVQAVGLLGGALATAAFLPGATVGGVMLRLDPGIVAGARTTLLASPAPWTWDALVLLLALPLWALPAGAGLLLLVLARLRRPRERISWARWLGRREARLAPQPRDRGRLRSLLP